MMQVIAAIGCQLDLSSLLPHQGTVNLILTYVEELKRARTPVAPEKAQGTKQGTTNKYVLLKHCQTDE